MNDRMTDSPPPRLWDAPPGRWARGKLRELWGIDLRSLALLRIGLGASVLADVAMRAFDLVGLYTDRGVLPRALVLAMDGPGVYLSAHYWASANPLLQGALFATTACCAVALLAGWRTRLATLACWYLVASVQIRQPLGYMGGDSILRLLLFWGLFLPLGARFSLDETRGRVPPRPDPFVSGATVAVLLQVCLIYWATGIRKTGELWWSGQALFYALHQDEYATALGVRLRDYPSLLEPMTYGTLGLELFGPFLAFVPIYTGAFRIATVAVFWAFHAGLAATMNIGLFPLFNVEDSLARGILKPTVYMSGEACVVTRPVGQNCDLITDGVNGVFADTPDDWFDQLSRLIENRDVLKRIAAAGLQTVHEQYTVEQCFNRLLAALSGNEAA